jgi:integrase
LIPAAIDGHALGRARAVTDRYHSPQRRHRAPGGARSAQTDRGTHTIYSIRDYPKDNEQREIAIGADLSRVIKTHMLKHGRRDEDLLFSTEVGTPISRNTFRTRVWLPAVEKSGVRRHVRFHDLRGAHATWLLAGGADLKVWTDWVTADHRLSNTSAASRMRVARTKGIRGSPKAKH